MIEDRGVWQAVLGELELTVTEANFKTWFHGTYLMDIEDGRLVVGVPNVFNIGRLEGQFAPQIKQTVTKVMPSVKGIDYRLGSVTPPKPVVKKTVKQAVPQQISLPTPTTPRTVPNNLNNRYTLDNFVVGPSNDFAHAAAVAIANSPGTKYNPLFMYGGVGLGKTHLMQAIGNEIHRQDPTKRIQYVSIESFTNEFINAIQNKRNTAFTDKYRNVDVLIIDDMQFLTGKEKTQDEFFHTFNALHQTNKQIVISCDKPPKQLKLEDRLISRFEMGITVDIQPPDLEMRSAILQSKAQAQGVILDLEVIDYLARHAQQNIRELEGLLTKVIARYEQRGGTIDLIEVQRLLAGEVHQRPRFKTLTPKTLIDKVAAYYDLAASDITGLKRDKEIVLPRQVAMYLMRNDLNMSYPKVAASVGGRDHTTAMHSVEKINKALEHDELLQSDVQVLRTQLTV